MADVKISQLPASTTPLDGTEVLPIVQSATTKQVSVANLTAGRAVSALSLSLTNALPVTSGGTGLSTTAAGTLLSSTALNTVSATATPTLGVAGTTAGTLTLSGLTSGTVTLKTALAAGTSTIFQLPASNGTNGYILTTDGAGVTTWTNPTALGIDLDVGSTAITNATDKYVLYNNNGTLGNYAVTGTGTTVVLSTSPTFTTGLTTPLAIGGTTASSSLTLQSTSGVGTSDSILFKVGNNGATTAATIDTAGNFGLGVTPSAWSSGGWIELNSTGVSSKGTLYSAGNTYYNGGWKYSTTAAASLYVQAAGANIWYTAPSGTAGTAISFTQAMTLDQYGSLLVGTTTSPTTTTNLGTISTPGTVQMGSSFKRNRLINGNMQVWQRGTSFTPGGAVIYTADRYWAYSLYATITRQSYGTTQFNYCTRIQRPVSNTGTGGTYYEQIIESINCQDLAGSNATFSFYARRGADYSPTSNLLSTSIFFGSGTDQGVSVLTGAGWTNQTNPTSTVTLTTSWQLFTVTVAVPANTNEISVGFLYTPTGTAGTNDYFEVTGLQFEQGSVATPYERQIYSDQLAQCQRYYTSINGGLKGLTSSTQLERVGGVLPVPMRSTPTLSLPNGSTGWFDGTVAGTLTAFATNYSSNTSIEFTSSAATGAITGNRPIVIYVGSGDVAASAEL